VNKALPEEEDKMVCVTGGVNSKHGFEVPIFEAKEDSCWLTSQCHMVVCLSMQETLVPLRIRTVVSLQVVQVLEAFLPLATAEEVVTHPRYFNLSRLPALL
jgi:hypothetical protein